MTDELQPTHGQFLVYQAEDGKIKLDVRVEGETVWLTQPMMAELLQPTQQNISQHFLNIYEEEELVPEATHKKYLLVRVEGTRVTKLDGFLRLNNRESLQNARRISHELVKNLLKNQYDKFNARRLTKHDNSLEQIEQAEKSLVRRKKGPPA